ncbi:CHAT domain-containing protein [Nocardiopsis sediminis]|uniref:CHAT domain-containing protein n=1 Tax=Nocardiopsis sediminis TaxID=1778267 RepID=A0ABV8FWI1_9ACTN
MTVNLDVLHPLTLIARDPRAAREHAGRLLDERPGPAARSAALRLLGMAQRELGDPRGAHRLLRQAAAVASRAGLDESAAHARASRIGLLALRDGGGVAGTSLDRMAAATPSARTLVHLHRGVAAAQHGRFGPAIDGFDTALEHLDRLDADTRDRILPGVLSNRGLALMYSGRLSESADDLERALHHAERQSLGYLRGVTLQNLGCLAVRRGDIAGAVSCFTDADPLVPASRRAALRLDHADALLAAGMFRDAARLIAGLPGGGHTSDDATTRLLRAKIDLTRGDRDAARIQARRVLSRFAADSLWSQLARLVEWSARHVPDHQRRSPRPHSVRPGHRVTGTIPADAQHPPALSIPAPDAPRPAPPTPGTPPAAWPFAPHSVPGRPLGVDAAGRPAPLGVDASPPAEPPTTPPTAPPASPSATRPSAPGLTPDTPPPVDPPNRPTPLGVDAPSSAALPTGPRPGGAASSTIDASHPAVRPSAPRPAPGSPSGVDTAGRPAPLGVDASPPAAPPTGPGPGGAESPSVASHGAAPLAPNAQARAEADRALARCVPSAPLGPLSMAVPAAHHVAALRALAEGDHLKAREALTAPAPGAVPEAGLRHLELLVHARAHQREVAAAGAAIALHEGDAATALEWVEHGRALTPVPGPCRDPGWALLLDRYRAAHARARRGDRSARDELARVASLLAPAQWHAGCTGHTAPAEPSPPIVPALAERLGSRAFLCHIDVPGVHAAVTVVDGRARVHPLPSAAPARDAVAKLLYAARTDVLAPGSTDAARSGRSGVLAQGRGADRAAAGPAALLDRLLLDPVREAVGRHDRPLVVAPAAFAQGLPWGLLPSLRGRAVSVVPSARTWLAREPRRAGSAAAGSPPPRALLTAGGGLDGAPAEVRALRGLRPGATVLTGGAARVHAVLDALGGADLAHIAAHGSTCPDAPMLSGVELADGPLLAYDLERLPRLPDLTVLSSCWVGGSTPAPSGLPLGLGSALLALGGTAVVAGVLPVRDRETGPAMVAFHRAVAAGTPPAQAVADHLAGAGFVCFGAG